MHENVSTSEAYIIKSMSTLIECNMSILSLFIVSQIVTINNYYYK